MWVFENFTVWFLGPMRLWKCMRFGFKRWGFVILRLMHSALYFWILATYAVQLLGDLWLMGFRQFGRLCGHVNAWTAYIMRFYDCMATKLQNHPKLHYSFMQINFYFNAAHTVAVLDLMRPLRWGFAVQFRSKTAVRFYAVNAAFFKTTHAYGKARPRKPAKTVIRTYETFHYKFTQLTS